MIHLYFSKINKSYSDKTKNLFYVSSGVLIGNMNHNVLIIENQLLVNHDFFNKTKKILFNGKDISKV